MARTTIMNKSNHIAENSKRRIAIDTYHKIRMTAGSMIIQPLLDVKKYKTLERKTSKA